MHFSLQTDTLSYQLHRPGVIRRSRVGIPVSGLAEQVKRFYHAQKVSEFYPIPWEEEREVSPESEALRFYLLNHAVSVVRQRVHPLEPLGPYKLVMDLYAAHLPVMTLRMFYYLLLICTRESRHCHSQIGSQVLSQLSQKHGQAAVNFQQSIRGIDSLEAAKKFMTMPPDIQAGAYTAFMADLFNEANFSSSFGGKKWGKIAELLRDFVRGTVSAETMLDTAFTLQHNTCSIFNKGMFYGQFGAELKTILDVQRSGQIPQYLMEHSYVGGPLERIVSNLKSIPQMDSMWGLAYVDWYAVETLGGMGSYSVKQKQQVAKYGTPPTMKATQQLAQIKQAAQAKAVAAEEAKWITVYPGFKLKKTTRENT